jgi:hypothetical protein
LVRTILIAVGLLAASPAAFADNYVNGYYRKNGTYVEPHYKSDPNTSKFDNFSTRGNTNPYTGRSGSVDPYKTDNSNNYGSSYGSSQRRQKRGW